MKTGEESNLDTQYFILFDFNTIILSIIIINMAIS